MYGAEKLTWQGKVQACQWEVQGRAYPLVH